MYLWISKENLFVIWTEQNRIHKTAYVYLYIQGQEV